MLYKTCRPAKGFTLFEMLLAIAIVGLFALLTLPRYQESLRTGRRGAAKAELLRLAQSEAKWRLTHPSYATLEELGGSAELKDYTFAVTNHSAATFTIVASPTSARGQNQDICGNLTIDQDAVIISNQSTCSKP